MTGWREQKLSDFMHFNPPTPLPNGSIAKKVAMEQLLPFNKKVQGYEKAAFKGGTKFQNGDTLMARITPCLENGKTAYVDFLADEEVAFGSTEFIVLRAKEGVSDSRFIFYLAISDEFRDMAIQLMSGTSGRQRVETEALKEKVFLLPPLPEQKAIAEVLSSLDDKIDLLKRQNKTLEDLAQAYFRKWFIEDASDEWEVGKLGRCVSVKGGSTPNTQINEYWNGNIAWATPKDLSKLSSLYLFDTERKITEKGLSQISSGLLPENTILLSSRAPIGYIAINMIPVAINQGFIAIICDKIFTTYFTLCWLKQNIELLIGAANGSTFLEISKSVFKNIEISIPCAKTIYTFEGLVKPLFDKILSNTKQILTLQKLRDALLPKLISGEIRVKM